MRQRVDDLLLKILGWRVTLFYGDACVADRWRWLRTHLRPGASRTLDAGCGTGAFSLYAGSIGNQVVGVSMDAPSLERARRRAATLGLDGVSFRHGNLKSLEQTDLWGQRFEQIICFETIEHIIDDTAVLRALAHLLADGGRLLLTTPYRDYPRLVGDVLSTSEDGGHVRWGYTHEEMKALLAQVGLQVTEQSYLSGVINRQLTNLSRTLQVAGALGWGATLPLRLLHWLDRPLTDILGARYLSIAVVARKAAHGNR